MEEAAQTGHDDGHATIDLTDPRPVTTVVLGRSGLTRDVISHTLEAADRATIGIDALERDESLPIVAVLVRPAEEDWMQAARLGASVVVVLESDSADEVIETLIRGANAVITTRSDPGDLLHAIDVVGAGGSVLEPMLARSILDHLRTITAQRPLLSLTPREVEILTSIERGDSIKQTARALGITEKTVQNLQSRLFHKLKARNRAQAVTRAHELGLLRTIWLT